MKHFYGVANCKMLKFNDLLNVFFKFVFHSNLNDETPTLFILALKITSVYTKKQTH